VWKCEKIDNLRSHSQCFVNVLSWTDYFAVYSSKRYFFTSIHQKPGGLSHILPAVVFSSTLQVNFEKISCNIEVSRPRPTFLLRSWSLLFDEFVFKCIYRQSVTRQVVNKWLVLFDLLTVGKPLVAYVIRWDLLGSDHSEEVSETLAKNLATASRENIVCYTFQENCLPLLVVHKKKVNKLRLRLSGFVADSTSCGKQPVTTHCQ